ncbi:MAG TPA: hypothetical protein VHW44_31655 [Pseudonocardiaceae bacterium]|jgi:hypothetical protein|nr:hypothetical protein [Pseudonocardiaceae bacterium]
MVVTAARIVVGAAVEVGAGRFHSRVETVVRFSTQQCGIRPGRTNGDRDGYRA